MAKILLIGDICAESQYLVDRMPSENSLSIVEQVNYVTSSKIVNAGRVLASNNDVSIFGVVGNDDKRAKVLEDLKRYGIDTKLIYSTNAPTDEVLVITDKNGYSAVAIYLPASRNLDQSKIENFSGYDYIYTATSLPLFQLYKIIERAHVGETKIFLDIPDQHEEFDLNMLKFVEFVVPNRQEAGLLLKREIINLTDGLQAAIDLKKYTNGHVIITLDKDGCIVFAKDWNKPQHFSIPLVKAVDSTGAGDIFRGVFLREYIKTHNIEISIKIALNISSESVKIKGVENSIQFIDKL